MPSILSLNLACSKHDEEHDNGLHKRLPELTKILLENSETAGVIALQEIRATGDMTVKDVVTYIQTALGEKWRAFSCPVNDSANSFWRVTLWDSSRIKLVKHVHTHLPTASGKDCSYLTSYFLDTWAHKKFAVCNAHAPMELEVKYSYWRELIKEVTSSKIPIIVVGSLNKFAEERTLYNVLLDDLIDNVGYEETFSSYPYDTNSHGNPYNSSLDAAITTTVCPTEVIDTNRASDHSLIRVHRVP